MTDFKEREKFRVTLVVHNKPIPCWIKFYDDGPPERRGGGRELGYPLAEVCIAERGPKWKRYCTLYFGKLDSEGDAALKMELLKYAAPAWAERVLDEVGMDAANEVHRVSKAFQVNSQNVIAVKAEIGGETYAQRSRLCYDDLCRRIVEQWRDPNSENVIVHDVFAASETNRRVYEIKEVQNVIQWAIGEGYLRGSSVARAANGPTDKKLVGKFPEIEGSRMRELERELAGRGPGALPEIAGNIDMGNEFGFVSDAKLREMIERDCREINSAAKAGNVKSVVILCGSLIEALLYDLLKHDEPGAKAKAGCLSADRTQPHWIQQLSSTLQRRSTDGLSKWAAVELIIVGHEMQRQKVTGDVLQYAMALKNYRNLIHPGKEEREKYGMNPYTASISISVVNLLLEGLR